MNNRVETIKSLVSEAKALDRFLMSRGIDPRFVTVDQKVSHAKSGEFQKWLRDRKFEEVESEDEVIKEQTPQEKFKSGLKKSGYDPDKGAKRLTDLIAKQKKDREEHEKQYGHLYAKEETVEEGLGKSIKRAVQGWGSPQDKPSNIVKRNKGYDTDTAKKIRAKLDDAPEHSPAGLQKRVLDRKLKGVAEDNNLKVSPNTSKGQTGNPYNKDVKLNGYVTMVGKQPKGEYERKVDKYLKKKYNKEEVEIDENHVAIAMGKEMDDEGSMTLNQLDQMQRGIDMVRNYVGKDMKKQLPSWVQSKITLATDYIDTVGNYLSTTNEEIQESFEDEHGIGDRKKQSTKSARIIKSIYKKKNMREDIYDHEKDDKSIATYGKKPKMAKTDDKAGMGENKPEAAAVMSGGTTLTGQDRDVIEIDPMMRKRPGQPDPNKK